MRRCQNVINKSKFINRRREREILLLLLTDVNIGRIRKKEKKASLLF